MPRSPKTPTRRRSKALVELFPHLGSTPDGPPGPNAAAETLRQMADAIHRTPTLAECQKTQLGFITGLLRARSAFLAEYSHLRDRLEIAAVKGRNEPRITAVRPKEGPVGEAFAENKLVRHEDLIAVPLQGAGGPLGALVLIAPRVDAPDALVEALAAQAAAAWEYARLREDTARREKDLQTALAGLKSMEKNREELLSNVSHDLKTPLTTVKAYLAMLGQGRMGEVPEKQLHAVHVAERNADRLLRMLNDVLLLSRLQTGKMQLTSRPFGLRALVSDVMSALASSGELSRVRLTLVPAPEVFVKGDRERLFEAVHNLVEHALFLCSPDGEVTVEVGSEPGLALLSVRDDGMGLPPEDLEGLFDAFHRSRTGPGSSVGLGLPITAKIVQLHGGRVEAESAPAAGTVRRVVLPAFAAQVGVADADGAVAPKAGHILLVEDDRDCREVLQELLEQEGYSVASCAGAEEARVLLEGLRPAMVLLDLRLSEEDGRSVLRHLRGQPDTAATPVFIISGASEVASLSTGTGLDRIDGFFEKPLHLPKLLDTVASVVRPVRSVR
jgi:signal transduction histidine kinase/CheY-like chemotaxis protein